MQVVFNEKKKRVFFFVKILSFSGFTKNIYDLNCKGRSAPCHYRQHFQWFSSGAPLWIFPKNQELHPSKWFLPKRKQTKWWANVSKQMSVSNYKAYLGSTWAEFGLMWACSSSMMAEPSKLELALWTEHSSSCLFWFWFSGTMVKSCSAMAESWDNWVAESWPSDSCSSTEMTADVSWLARGALGGAICELSCWPACCWAGVFWLLKRNTQCKQTLDFNSGNLLKRRCDYRWQGWNAWLIA